MSAIGEYYIHYFKVNYQAYGIEQRNVGELLGSDNKKITKKNVKQIRKHYKASAPIQNLKSMRSVYGANDKLKSTTPIIASDIEHNLNKMFYSTNQNNQKKYIPTYQKVLQEQKDLKQEQLKDFCLDTLTYSGKEGGISKIKSKTLKEAPLGEKRQILIKDYIDKVTEMRKQAAQLINNGDDLIGNEILTKLDRLTEKYIQVSTTTYNKISNDLEDIGEIGYLNTKTRDTDAIVNGLNSIIEIYKLGIPPKYTIEGVGFEYWLATALGIYEKQTIQQMIQSVKGSGSYTTNTNPDNSVDDFAKSIGSDVRLQASYDHRNKIDVTTTWKNIQLDISAKAYDSFTKKYKWINVVGDTVLGEMLQVFSKQQIAHFANISALYLGEEAVYNSFLNEIKIGLFWQAITGNYGGNAYKNSAKWLILFDKNSKDENPIKVISINDILLHNNSNVDSKLSYLSIFLDGMPLKKWHLKNTWKSDGNGKKKSRSKAQERVNMALQDLHHTKVKASINMGYIIENNIGRTVI